KVGFRQGRRIVLVQDIEITFVDLHDPVRGIARDGHHAFAPSGPQATWISHPAASGTRALHTAPRSNGPRKNPRAAPTRPAHRVATAPLPVLPARRPGGVPDTGRARAPPWFRGSCRPAPASMCAPRPGAAR